MSEMALYRRWQLRAIDRNLLTLAYIIESVSDPAAFQGRDPGDEEGWTISEVLGHLGDFECYMLERTRYIIGERQDEPMQPPGPRESVALNDYASQEAGELLSRWQACREAHLATLGGLDVNDDELWQRGFAFAGGPFTLNNQLLLTGMHDDDHMNQIVKIIRSA